MNKLFEKAFLNLAPTQFERYSLELLKEQTKNLDNVKFKQYI